MNSKGIMFGVFIVVVVLNVGVVMLGNEKNIVLYNKNNLIISCILLIKL